ncbi:MAG TPA: DUF3341 domain-containing protein [Deltaproteobacteria bacterium]|nr:DUF3341 domain-containing protein [Deltaproteobacteria bacterium]
MNTEKYIMGFFRDEDQAAQAVTDLKESPYTLKRVHGPFPSHKISRALGQKKSKIGYFTLAGGIFGFFAGFVLAVYASIQWNLMVSGKPVISYVPFFIVGFEFTILFAVFGNIIGMLLLSRLTNTKIPVQYDDRCSGEYFGLLATCSRGELDTLADFFKSKGGETRIFE